MQADTPGPILLAAYGTLMTGHINPISKAARALMGSLGPCLLTGTLYEVRERTFVYPALVLAAAPDAPPVRAELFAIGASAAEAAIVLAETDAYENCRPGDARRSTYLRQLVPVRYPDRGGTVQAWVYVYNRPLAGAVPIPDGYWRAPDHPVPFAAAGSTPRAEP